MELDKLFGGALRKLDKKRKQAGIPPVPKNADPESRQFFEALRENLAVRMGQEGDPLEQAVTFKDFAKAGMLNWSGGVGLPGSGTPGITPGTPDFDYSPPPAPTNLTASGGFDMIFLDWDHPRLLYNYYAEVWRSPVDTLDLESVGMKFIGTANSPMYIDHLNGDRTTYYYWVRYVKAIGSQLIFGPFNATAGTPAQITLDPDYVIDLLEGQIGESELANELLTPIQSIPSIQDTLVDHGGRIASTEAALSDLLNLPAFDENESYSVDDLVTYGGFAWRALTNMTAPSPTPVEGADWTKVGQYATFSDIIAANALAIDDLDVRVTSAEGTITSYGTSITALQNRVTDTENNIGANSLAISTLDSRITTTEGQISSQSSAITLLQDDLSTLDGAVAANAGALSLLDNRVTGAEGTITSQGSAIVQLQNDLQTLDVDGNAAAIDSLTTRVEDVEGDVSATAQSLTQLEATVDGQTAAIQTKASVTALQGVEDDVATLSAQYTVKLDVNGRVAGIGLANNNGVTEFVVASDAVYFIDPGQSITAFNPDTNYTSMAALRNTQFVFGYAQVEGQRRFAINVPAYIPEATITNAMIKNATITGAKIANATIGGAKINIADIWDLNIGNEVKSDNYIAGAQGWRVSSSGFAEFSNVTVRGHVEMTTGYISDSVQIGGVLQYNNFAPGNFIRSGSTITSSATISNVAYLKDGVRGISSNYWSLSSGIQYLQADLGSERYVSENRMFFYALDGRRYKYAVAVSTDGNTWEYVVGSGPTNGGNATGFVWSRSAAGGYEVGYEFPTITPIGKFARYVRVWMNGNSVNTGNHGYEWELYGSGGGGDDPYVASIGSGSRTASTLTDYWVKPGFTWIDGTKIYTGDAYVDTLQIKGQAVTIPAGTRRQQPLAIGSSFTTVASFNFNNNTNSVIGGILTGLVRVTSADGESTIQVEARAVVNGTPIDTIRAPDIVPISSYVSLPKGVFSVAIQARQINGWSMSVVGSIAVIGAKR